jgi:hypothetical protein
LKALSESAFMIIDLTHSICNQNGLGTFPSDGVATTQSRDAKNFSMDRCPNACKFGGF